MATVLHLAVALVIRPESDSDSGSGDNLLTFKNFWWVAEGFLEDACDLKAIYCSGLLYPNSNFPLEIEVQTLT